MQQTAIALATHHPVHLIGLYVVNQPEISTYAKNQTSVTL